MCGFDWSMENIPEGGFSSSEHNVLSITFSKILNSNDSCDYLELGESPGVRRWNVKRCSKLRVTHLGLSVTACAFPSQHPFSVQDRSDHLQAQLGLSVHPHVRMWAVVSEQSTATHKLQFRASSLA